MKDQEIETFIKDTDLQDLKLIMLVISASVQLRDEDLPNSKRVDLVSETLKITSQIFYDLASKTKTSFKQEDKK